MPSLYRLSSRRRWLGILFVCSLTVCLWLGQFSPTILQVEFGKVVIAQSSHPSQLVQQGVEQYQAGNYNSAIEAWKNALKLSQNNQNQANKAIILENLARAYQQIGQTETAIAHWQQAISNYYQLGDIQQVGRLLTEQAQAYSRLGQHQKAIALLCHNENPNPNLDCPPGSALQIARQQNDPLGEVAALGSLGEVYRLRGRYDQAIEYLETAKNFNDPAYQDSILNSLGNAHFSRAQLWNLRANSARQLGAERANKFEENARTDYQNSLNNFQFSFQLAREQDDLSASMRSLLNLVKLYYRAKTFNLGNQTEVDKAIEQALILFEKLPDSSSKVYAAIDLATLPEFSSEVTSPLTQCPQQRELSDSEAKNLFTQAINISQKRKYSRAESFAKGAIAHFYECQKDYKQALKLTQEALWTADQNLKALDSLYLWEWQTGRILKAQGKDFEAISAYDRALTILEKIRSDILTAQRDIQFDFRDIIEPLYRQLAQLRLELVSSYPSIKAKQRNKELTVILKTVDSLQLAELQNNFGDDCVLTAINEENTDNLIQKGTAVFSSIVLEDRIAVLLNLPNGEKRFNWIAQPRETVITEIRKFRQGLRKQRELVYDPTEAETLYNWIIKPFEEDLKQEPIKTLVFIQDGLLRTIPMAALYDGKQFLVEKYAIAVTPSLRLTDSKISNLQQRQALVLGVTKAVQVDGQKFSALQNVADEIKDVQEQFANSKPLVDEEFTPDSLEKQLNQTVYPVIHMATHAQFGTIPEDTFIVTGNSGKLTINQLETALRQIRSDSETVEILALTACETALGDERAALGLAGVAVQAGARSALASLWRVDDKSTSILVTEFYNSLVHSGLSKAEALQAAQKKLIDAFEREEISDRYAHPYFWAGFILIGNWL